MEREKYMLLSLEDSKMKALSEVLGSKTCKKIINYLADNKEASQKDLSLELNIPMNTLGFNIKKLLKSGIIQKRKNFFWSKKGRKIIMYELSNKSIVISPKKSSLEKLKSILPSFIITLAATFAVYTYEKINLIKNYTSDSLVPVMVEKVVENNEVFTKGANTVLGKSSEAILSSGNELMNSQLFLWPWFLTGALLALIIFLIVNWRKL